VNPKLAIVGAKGRMGQHLCRLAESEGWGVGAALDQGDDIKAGLSGIDAVIEFSFHTATVPLAQCAADLGLPVVIGTTGHCADDLLAIRECAKKIPVVLAPNFSVGVNTLFWLTKKTAEILGSDFDLEIIEMHHNLKKDAPSGTAKRLAEILCDVRHLQYQKDVMHGREGLVGERQKTEIGMHALRGGDVVGEHTVVYAIGGERVELTHKASSRETFARGALRAAKWLLDKQPGLYDMQNVLGLTT